MKLHLAQLPKLIVERRSSALFGVAIIAMLWGGICLKYLQDVRGDQREAERTNRNFAMVFEENVLRSIGEIDKSLLYLRRTIETRQDTTDYHTIVNTADLLSEIIVQVAIIDAKGIMRASNAGPQPAPEIDLSDREHYRVHLNSAEDRLFISKPVIGRASKQWSVQFTRRFLNSEGKFGGVVVTSLNPTHLTDFYNRIDFGASTTIALVGRDGVVRSSGGGTGGFQLGQDLGNAAMFRHAQTSSTRTFEDFDPATGRTRLVTFRQVRGHPLLVSVGLDRSEIFRGSRADFLLNCIAGLLLTLIILAAMERILATEAKVRQKADQLQLTLENMSQGIMLVTGDLRIPIINSRCGELLGLPPEFIKNPPRFDHLLDYQFRANEERKAGHAAPETAKADPISTEFSISERTMPNGHVIEVRSGNLPDGSFVQTFTDITKRREAEAHVARLASEDPLTGLPNRRVFRASVEELCRLYGSLEGGSEGADFAVLFLDVDRFKVINDTLGHRVGDMLLQVVANRLKTSLPDAYILARLGGDEFAIVVPSMQSVSLLETLAKSVVEMVVQPYEIDGYQIRSSISIGIAVGTARRQRRRRAPDGRRLGALRRQGRGPRRLQVLQPGDEHRAQRPPRTGDEPPRRDRAERARVALPADHRPQAQRHHRLRGAGALAPSGQGHDPPCRVHSGGGRHRIDPSDRRMGACGSVPAGRAVAKRPQDRRQPVARADSRAQSSGSRAARALRLRPGAAIA